MLGCLMSAEFLNAVDVAVSLIHTFVLIIADTDTELGHTVRACTEERSEMDRIEVKCVNCEAVGHRARDCPGTCCQSPNFSILRFRVALDSQVARHVLLLNAYLITETEMLTLKSSIEPRKDRFACRNCK